jgi:hypothetical protein
MLRRRISHSTSILRDYSHLAATVGLLRDMRQEHDLSNAACWGSDDLQ